MQCIPTDLHLLIQKAASCDSSQRQLHLCHHACFLIIPSAGAIAIGHHSRAIATRLNCLACLVFVVIPGRNDMTDWSFSCPRELAPPIRPPQKAVIIVRMNVTLYEHRLENVLSLVLAVDIITIYICSLCRSLQRFTKSCTDDTEKRCQIRNAYMAMNFFYVINERLRPILFDTY